MSRRIVLAAAMVAFGGWAGVAEAQVPIRFGVAGGVSAPAGDLSKVTNTGYNAGLFMEIKAPALPVGFRIEGAWNQFGFDKQQTGPLDGNARALSLTGNALVDIPSSTLLRFYGIGGIGAYKTRTVVEGPGGFERESETKFGYNLGVGMKLPLPMFQPFFEVRYHNVVESRGMSFVPVVFGIKF